ncbi:hypothetical protein GCM10025868_39370 [Angustibacter aerolatus]|uniref:Alpha-1,4-glucan:maltose-1-phosphate maltosyltransferase domain-containing protein n=1 Tax=Angustibacter aerolatus TaxID=1162965 RepID=A0ABQ6JLM9_9ACTN|nr:maltotransferase domain-containing protein [Angustibacter aerolatus]GMA88687.1 hypothetical protein GCM10025868_39370 [Angustibacter aerolatus]
MAVIGRIPVLDVTPAVDAGRWPARAVVGEAVPVRATVFREGHDAVAATVVTIAPGGGERHRVRMDLLEPGLDLFGADVVLDEARSLAVPGRGLVRPLRHLGARRGAEGGGRRRHRA